MSTYGYSDMYDVFYDTGAIYTLEHRDSFKVGDLVTCGCHGGVGLLLSISYIEDQPYSSIDIGRVSWVIKKAPRINDITHHTIARLRKLELP